MRCDQWQAAGRDGFQAPHPGVSISEVCHLGNDAHQPQIPGRVCKDPDQARPGQAEGTTPIIALAQTSDGVKVPFILRFTWCSLEVS